MIRITEIEENPFHTLRYRTSGSKGNVLNQTLPFYRASATGLESKAQCMVLTSDLQGREVPATNRLLGEAVADELQLLVECAEIPKVDVVILAGDLYDYPDCRKRGGTGDVSDVWQRFAQIANAVVGVNGNHDVFNGITSESWPVTLLDGNKVTKSSIRIGGLGGVIGDPKRHLRRWDDDFLEILLEVLHHRPDLLVLHQGPDDPENGRRGDPGIRSILESEYPGLTVFGHSHWKAPFLIDIGLGQGVNVDGRVLVLTTDQDGFGEGVLSYERPTIEELKAAHAAESKTISDKIAAGYDFKKEKQNSIFREMTQKRREIVERERAARKSAEEKK